MVDLHAEIVKAQNANSEMETARARLHADSQLVFKDTSGFHSKLFKVFSIWISDAAVEVLPGKTATFDDVIDVRNQNYAIPRSEWVDLASEHANVTSWSLLQKKSSAVLGQCTSKEALELKSKIGRTFWKDAIAFVRSVKKS